MWGILLNNIFPSVKIFLHELILQACWEYSENTKMMYYKGYLIDISM